jgi:hypothetical protein
MESVITSSGNVNIRIPWPLARGKPALASRFYQLRMNKVPTGSYLMRIGKAANDKCWWCCPGSESGPSQTREHLFKDCSRWKEQQVIIWRGIRRATGGKRTPRNTSMAQLFGDERCTAAILEFLAPTEVGVRETLREDDLGGGERGWSDTEGADGMEGDGTEGEFPIIQKYCDSRFIKRAAKVET